MNYASTFNDVIEYCKINNLFLGFGNPNAKVLVIGKEQAYPQKEIVGTPAFIKEILDNREFENAKNISGWLKNIQQNTIPNWDDMPLGLLNPLYSYGSQLNVANKEKLNAQQEKIGNGGTSNTYLKYQKLYQYLQNRNERSEKINFQKEFFLTELSDIPTKYSYRDSALLKVKDESIAKRKELFAKEYFKTFPITIIAAGHYPRDHGFDIQKIFDTRFIKNIEVGTQWFNLHYGTSDDRILIHTRQLSMDVTDDLLKAIAGECRPFFQQ